MPAMFYPTSQADKQDNFLSSVYDRTATLYVKNLHLPSLLWSEWRNYWLSLHFCN